MDQNVATLLAAIVGGLLTIIGVFVATSLSQKADKKKMFQDKVEELLLLISDIGHNMYAIRIKTQDIQKSKVYTNEDRMYILDLLKTTSYTARKLKVILKLYIPDLLKSYIFFESNMNEIIYEFYAFMEDENRLVTKYTKSSRQNIDHIEEVFRISILDFAKKHGFNL